MCAETSPVWDPATPWELKKTDLSWSPWNDSNQESSRVMQMFLGGTVLSETMKWFRWLLGVWKVISTCFNIAFKTTHYATKESLHFPFFHTTLHSSFTEPLLSFIHSLLAGAYNQFLSSFFFLKQIQNVIYYPYANCMCTVPVFVKRGSLFEFRNITSSKLYD